MPFETGERAIDFDSDVVFSTVTNLTGRHGSKGSVLVSNNRMAIIIERTRRFKDFENIMKKSCGLSVGIPNIVILDTEGKMRDTRSGHVDDREFDELTAAINLLRRESEPRNRAVGSGPLPSKKQQ